MKKFFITGIAMMMVVAFSSAQAGRIKADLDLGYFSRYVYGMSGQTIYDHSVFQQSVTLTDAPTGLYGQIWLSYSPKNGPNDDPGDEMDFVVGIYNSFHRVNFDVEYAFYDLQDMEVTRDGLHMLRLYLEPETDRFKIKPYVSIEGNIPVDDEILEGGFLYKMGARYQQELFGQTFDLDLSVGGNDGAYGTKPKWLAFAQFGVSTTFKVWRFNVSPSINFQKKLGDNNEIAEDKVWYGVNLSIPLL